MGTATNCLLGFCAMVAIPLHGPLATLAPGAYRLDDACQWKRAGWADQLGAQVNPPLDHARLLAHYRCEQRLGLKSAQPFVSTILPSWPSQAQLDAWQAEVPPDAELMPLPAHMPVSSDTARDPADSAATAGGRTDGGYGPG